MRTVAVACFELLSRKCSDFTSENVSRYHLSFIQERFNLDLTFPKASDRYNE